MKLNSLPLECGLFSNVTSLLPSRFDHSPCDPTITLHGSFINSFACVVCYKNFVTQQQYRDHLFAKVRACPKLRVGILFLENHGVQCRCFLAALKLVFTSDTLKNQNCDCLWRIKLFGTLNYHGQEFDSWKPEIQKIIRETLPFMELLCEINLPYLRCSVS